MREFHAQCVKFSRIELGLGKSFGSFAGISWKNTVGIGDAKEV
jgi:hypothetical protein